MISIRTKRITFGVLLAGLLTVTAACSLVAAMRGAPAVKPTYSVVQAPAPQVVPAGPPANGES